MFSAGNDLSIVTWYRPHETDASPPAAQVPASPPTPHEEQERGWRHDSGSTEELSPALFPPPSPAAQAPAEDEVAAVRAAGGGVGTAHGGGNTAVTHESDPGIVVHLAEVVGLAAVPGSLVSADMAGRLLERGPDRLIGKYPRFMHPKLQCNVYGVNASGFKADWLHLLLCSDAAVNGFG